MFLKCAALVSGFALGLMSVNAEASYIMKVRQVGADVLATGSGRLNLSGLSGPYLSGFTPLALPAGAYLPIGDGDAIDEYIGVSGPSSFGSVIYTIESTRTGAPVEFYGGNNSIGVPVGYLSGSDLGVSTATWRNKTLSELGMEIGTYKLNWSGDSMILNISAVPLPAPAPLFGAALLALLGFGYGMKRKKSAATV